MELSRKLHAINELNRIAGENIQNILDQLKQYEGKKIQLADGGKSKGFVVNLPEISLNKYNSDSYANLQNSYIHLTTNSVYWRVSGCFKYDDHGCFYENKAIYIGEISKQILTKVLTVDEIGTFEQHSLNEQIELFKRREQLKNELDLVNRKIVIKETGYFELK